MCVDFKEPLTLRSFLAVYIAWSFIVRIGIRLNLVHLDLSIMFAIHLNLVQLDLSIMFAFTSIAVPDKYSLYF